ncbi:MAG: twin-arginine translocase subunit TatC, partial [Candidatus Zixiibacteriota bacterium]
MPETINVSNRNSGKDKEMSFGEHLDDLRGHIIRGIIAVILVAIIAFLFKDFFFNQVILAPKDAGFITNLWLCEFSHLIGINTLCINQVPFTIINIDL